MCNEGLNMMHFMRAGLTAVLVTVVLTGLTPGLAMGQDGGDGPRDLEAPATATGMTEWRDPWRDDFQLVVSGTRVEQRIFEAPRSIAAVDRTRINEMQARTTTEALRETPGVFMQETNRGSGTPFLRGFSGPQNLMLVDGVQFNLSTFRTGPNQYLALTDPLAMSHIEVLRGPSSVLYGNGAMGGVINFVTRSPEVSRGATEVHGEALMRFASADFSPTTAGEMTVSAGPFAMLVGGSYSHFGTLRLGENGELPLSAYEAGGWRLKLVYSPTWNHTLSASYFGATIQNAGRIDDLGKGDTRDYDNLDHFAVLRYRYRDTGIVRDVQVAGVYHRWDEGQSRYTCGRDADGIVIDNAGCAERRAGVVEKLRFNDDAVDSAGATASVTLEPWREHLTLMLGGEFFHDWIASSRGDAAAADGFVLVPAERGTFSDGATYRSLGVFVHTDIVPVRFGGKFGELHVTGGGRFSNFAANADDVPGLGTVNYEFSGFVGSGGIQWMNPEMFNLYVSFAQGFRAPNLEETTVLGDQGDKFYVPNGGLNPEKSNTIEGGARFDFGPVELGAAYFHSFLSDFLEDADATFEGASEVDGKPVRQRVNRQGGTIRGVEASIAAQLWRFTVSADTTWTEGEVELADGTLTPGRRIPPLFGRAGVRYTHTADLFYVETFTQWQTRQTSLAPGDQTDLRICETSAYSGALKNPCTEGTPGWATANIRAGWKLTKHFDMQLALLNLTDNRYRWYASGIDAPGLDARLTIGARF